MEKKENKNKLGNRIFYIILVLLIIGSVGATFYKIVILKDYQITAETSCDPVIESCFYMPCDDTDPSCDPTAPEYYKKIEKKASNIELCDPSVDGCNPMVCAEGEKDCSITACTEDNLADGEECSTSTQE